MQATVSFGLESPTEPLDKIFFPSIVVCNMNSLSGSFLHEISEDSGMSNQFSAAPVHERIFCTKADLQGWSYSQIFRYTVTLSAAIKAAFSTFLNITSAVDDTFIKGQETSTEGYQIIEAILGYPLCRVFPP